MEKIAKQLVWNVLFEKAVSYDEKNNIYRIIEMNFLKM